MELRGDVLLEVALGRMSPGPGTADRACAVADAEVISDFLVIVTAWERISALPQAP